MSQEQVFSLGYGPEDEGQLSIVISGKINEIHYDFTVPA